MIFESLSPYLNKPTNLLADFGEMKDAEILDLLGLFWALGEDSPQQIVLVLHDNPIRILGMILDPLNV